MYIVYTEHSHINDACSIKQNQKDDLGQNAKTRWLIQKLD